MSKEGVIRRPTFGEPSGDGSYARYCTVDDPVTGSGTGAVELSENDVVVTVFTGVCTDFTQRAFGDEYRIEALISQIIQSVGLVKHTFSEKHGADYSRCSPGDSNIPKSSSNSFSSRLWFSDV
jgi:hypothetical protein